MPRDSNPNFMNGVPELLILKLLDQREMYGYEIVQAIREQSGAIVQIGEGVVYPVLHGLERQGAVKSRRKTVSGRRRIYYSVTQPGVRRLTALADDWNRLALAVSKMLTGGDYVKAAS
jgi:PadR family transcriptional regulator PadR